VDVYRDHRRARSRQSAIVGEALEARAAGRIGSLTLFQEDCRPGGVVKTEQAQIAREAALRGLDPAELGIQPGADEAGMLLVARAALGDRPGPRVRVVWGAPGLSSAVPPYEDRPLGETVEAKLRLVGARLVRGESDFVLYVHGEPGAARDAFLAPVSVGGGRWRPPIALGRLLERDVPVGIADIRYANAADASLMGWLIGGGSVSRLASYAGWNTAANTLGTLVAHLVSLFASPSRSPLETPEQRHFMAHRLLEDFVYASLVRPRFSEWLSERGMHPLYVRVMPKSARRALDELVGFASRLVLGSLGLRPDRVPRATLPWLRTFEAEICPGPCERLAWGVPRRVAGRG
jgi:hypothetical protein